ncbi:hypothetical protein P3592_25835 [Vibrio parahaemolyticus]|nr:hypothetical protein [Vibrio parahaemolyticus]MDF4804322.1 hypothetical protein [Vibrio parahaemolyticus]MDF4810764.1 hypothetical protein [Vibrio parahaemolyticus]MDF4855194.1 hypothetical protein [Vibrio parahaemolyticus]
MVTVLCRNICIACRHPLTRRYYRNGSLRLNAKGCKLGVKQAG